MEIGPVLTDILDATTDLTNRSSQPLAVASKFAYGQFNLQFCSGGRSRQRWLSSVSLVLKSVSLLLILSVGLLAAKTQSAVNAQARTKQSAQCQVASWNVKPWIAIVGLLHKPHDARQLSGVSNPASEA